LTNTAGTTFQAGDVINGGAGTDTVTISVAGGQAGTNAAVTFTGVEKVLVNNVNSTTQSISLALADSSLTTVGHASSNTSAVTTFAGLKKIVDSELSNGDAGITLTYNATVIAGSADAATLTLNNQTGGSFTSTGIETLNVVSTTSANTITLATSHATVNASGAANLTLGAVPASVNTLNASAMTGNLSATLSDNIAQVVTGGAGNDTITAGTNLTATGAGVNAGAGIDTLVSTANAVIAIAADGARYTNFETLSISSTALVNGAQTRAQDVSLIGGITTVNVTSARVDGQAANATHGVTLTNFAATTNTLNVSSLANADTTVGVDGLDVLVTATRAINTTTDSMTVNLGTSTATVGTTGVATGGAAAGAVTLAISLVDEESITINSLGGASGTNLVGAITDTAATSVTFTGARALTMASLSGQLTTTINASAMTGALTMGTNAGTVASTITGGTASDSLVGGSAADNISGGTGSDSINGADGNDVITGGDGVDVINGGAGIDNLSGGAGNDTFNVTTIGDFTSLSTAEVVSGGADSDNLSFSQAATILTIAAADLVGINSIETITINGTTHAGSITLTDAVYTSNGLTSLAIVDGLLDGNTGGTLTVAASALTAANSIAVTANTVTGNNDTLTGGAGADTFTFATIAGLEATDTVVGGGGTDTIFLTATAPVTAVLDGVRTVERVTTTGNGGAVSVTLGASTIAATGTLTTDASSLTNPAFALTYRSALNITAGKSFVTGGAGNDDIVGGTGNDTVIGGLGNDTITGGPGTDNLSGGDGNDVFIVVATGTGFTGVSTAGLTTAETVSGGTGNDTLQFVAGTLTISAQDLTAMSGIETIEIKNIGETASLTLSDTIYSTNGATTLAVDAKTMTTGVLTLAASTLSAANSVQLDISATGSNALNVINLGAGNDTVAADLDALDTGTIAGGAGTDVINISLSTTNTARTLSTKLTGFETINFTSPAATLAATIADAYSIVTVDENVAAGITQTINGSNLTGTLTWNGAAEADGKFSITGGIGSDNLTGGQLVDTITGGLGTDVITGGIGADVLSGGLGADTFVYTSGITTLGSSIAESNSANTDSISDFVSLTDKLQVTLDYSMVASPLDISATKSSNGVAGTALAQDTLTGQRGQWVYDTTGSALFINFNNDNLLTASDFKIAINAGSTATTTVAEGDINFIITGGTGADTILAGGGADTINMGQGDSVNGGAGIDTFAFAAVSTASSITGGSGADVVTLFAGANTLTVGDTDGITITTSTGIQTIAGTGIIAINAAAMPTEAMNLSGTGAFTVTGWASTGILTDASTAAISVTLAARATGTLALGTGIVGTDAVVATALLDTQLVTLTGDNDATVSLILGDLSAAAYAGALTVTATTGTNLITTGTGADTIDGGAGIDTIVGGAGADTITTGADSDIVRYETLATITGAAGVNVDTILDFTTTADKINFGTTGSGAGATIKGVTLNPGTTTAATFATAITDATVVADIAAVYTAIAANTAFSVAGNFAVSGAGAGGIIAKLISFANGAAAGQYLVVNDSTAAFVAADDIVIRVVGTVVAADLSFTA
jgi:Ca2+-binding RTX toxin-like protein